MTTEMRSGNRDIIHLLPIVEADGCARYGKGEATCRWKCGSQCAHEVPNTSENPTFQDVMRRFVSRRSLVRGAAATTVGMVVAPALAGGVRTAAGQPGGGGLSYAPITLANEDNIVVPAGYTSKALIRWGDPLFLDAPAFDPTAQTAAAQVRQFGYNADFVGFFPLDGSAGNRALLAVNHEYTNPEIMFPGYSSSSPTREQADVELAAHGLTIVEIQKTGMEWSYLRGSPYNRRITGETEMLLTGPAAGSDLFKTAADPTGTIVRGTLNNCSAGKTPWGTVLTCEENFNQYFGNLAGLPDSDLCKTVHQRYGLTATASERKWERFYDRFDVAKEPNEAFRFGWAVEIDPLDAASTPRKRTALGRVKHEATSFLVGPDNRVGVYMGDDERFDYVYKFVTARPMDRANRAANADLLDTGTLYAAKFNEDGTGEWLPLIAGQGALTAANGFGTQAEVLIKTRQAGDAVGATKMDRPEDVEVSPVTSGIYIALTNNTNRMDNQVNAANPRDNNRFGHIIELFEANNDPTSLQFRWDIFMLCGPRDDASRYFAGYPADQISAISSPDNLNFDRAGNLWIWTDGAPGTIRVNDTVYSVPTQGPERGALKPFLSGVPGAETAGGDFSDDNEALFVSIQHPGEGAMSTFESPLTRWPDFGDNPPRPSVVAAWKTAAGSRVIGS